MVDHEDHHFRVSLSARIWMRIVGFSNKNRRNRIHLQFEGGFDLQKIEEVHFQMLQGFFQQILGVFHLRIVDCVEIVVQLHCQIAHRFHLRILEGFHLRIVEGFFQQIA